MGKGSGRGTKMVWCQMNVCFHFFIFDSVLLAPYLTDSFSIRYLMQEGAVGKHLVACLEPHALDGVYDGEPI